MQAPEIRFLQKIKGVTMFHKLRNTAIRESFNFESLILRIKRPQLRWFGHVSKMPHERFFKQTLYAELSGMRQLDFHEQNGLIILRILVGTVWVFVQAKCSICWWIERCGDLIWSCCPQNLQESVNCELVVSYCNLESHSNFASLTYYRPATGQPAEHWTR